VADAGKHPGSGCRLTRHRNASPATSPPSNATDTGSGNGFTPVTISAAGMRAGRTYRSQITVQSQNAAGNPGTVAITAHALGPHPAKPKRR